MCVPFIVIQGAVGQGDLGSGVRSNVAVLAVLLGAPVWTANRP